MTNKEAIEILKESANRNKVSLEIGIDMMSSDTLEWVTNETEALTKAFELLEAEEEERLIKLPCKVGDKLFVINKFPKTASELYEFAPYSGSEIKEITVNVITVTKTGYLIQEGFYETQYDFYDCYKTREEAAEQSLKGDIQS